MYGVLLVTLTHIHGFNDDRESPEYIVHRTVWDPVIALYLNGVGLYSSYFLKQTGDKATRNNEVVFVNNALASMNYYL